MGSGSLPTIWKSFHHGTNVIKSETGSGELETSNGNLGGNEKMGAKPDWNFSSIRITGNVTFSFSFYVLVPRSPFEEYSHETHNISH